jgi:hypothetical protein
MCGLFRLMSSRFAMYRVWMGRRSWAVMSWAIFTCAACASVGANHGHTDEQDVRLRAEQLCRYAVFRSAELQSYGRNASELATLLIPGSLAAVQPCEGDYAEVSKCTQEYVALSLARSIAPHVKCQVLGINPRSGDHLQVLMRRVAPVIPFARVVDMTDLTNGTVDFATLPTMTTEHALMFRWTERGWLADFAFSDAADGGPPANAR